MSVKLELLRKVRCTSVSQKCGRHNSNAYILSQFGRLSRNIHDMSAAACSFVKAHIIVTLSTRVLVIESMCFTSIMAMSFQ